MEESGLKWRLALISSLGYHMGPLVLQYRTQLISILAGAAAAPSQVGGICTRM